MTTPMSSQAFDCSIQCSGCLKIHANIYVWHQPSQQPLQPFLHQSCMLVYYCTCANLKQLSSGFLTMIHATAQTWLFSTQASCFCFQRRLSESNGYPPRCQKRVSANAVSVHISGILCDDLHHMLCLLLSAFWGTRTSLWKQFWRSRQDC